MNYKQKKEILEQYQNAVHRIKGLQREYETWLTIGTGITQKLSPVNVKSGNSDKIANAAIKCAEMQSQIAQEIETAEKERLNTISLINSCVNARHKDILTMIYINGMSVNSVARSYNKDRVLIYKSLKTAINQLNV